jgi:murein tripeptide amidase MpaA
VALFALVAGTAGATHKPPSPAQLVRVAVPTFHGMEQLDNSGLDLSEHAGRGFVDVVLHSPADAERLRATGLEWEVTIPDLDLHERRNSERNAAYAAATALSPLPSGRDTYRTLADYEADLRQLAAQSPTLVRLITLSRRSVEGRQILGVEISDTVRSRSDGKPVFLMIGLHHAREWPSGELSIEFAFDLVASFGVSQRVTELLRKVRVIVVPVLNVDGFDQSRKWGELVPIVDDDGGEEPGAPDGLGNLNKRKNCRVDDGRPTPPGGCDVASPDGYGAGVDLNRNYGWLWGGRGASADVTETTYRGRAAFSEPETQAIRELVSSRHVTTLITNHTFSNLVLRPPGLRSEGTTVDEQAMKALGARMAAQNGYRNRLGWQLYDTTGSTESWSYNATGGFGYTFEIGPREFRPPFPLVVDEYLGAGVYAGKGNREAFFIALESAADPRRHSVITGTAPVGVTLRLSKAFDTPTSLGTIRDRLVSTFLVPPGGRFTWHVNPSTRPSIKAQGDVERYRLTCERPAGRVLQTVQVAVERGNVKRLRLEGCARRLQG